MNKNVVYLVEETVKLINNKLQSEEELKEYVSNLIYSLGSSFEGKTYDNSEELMADYYSNPSLGKALMAQALIFQDKWMKEEH